MSLGSTLRSAREASGMTTSELAARTHMLVQIVEGLENEDFRRIPAPIYGRGFIKLYCEAVGLDPKPLQAEFMDLFTRSKEAPEKKDSFPSRASRPEPPPPPPPVAEPPPLPPPVAEPAERIAQPVSEIYADSAETDSGHGSFHEEIPAETVPQTGETDFGDLFSQPVQPAYSMAPEPARPAEPVTLSQTQPPPKRSYGDLFGQTYTDDEVREKPSAAEKFRNTMSNVSSGVFANVQKLPPNTGRIVAVSALGVILLGFIGWGVSALYKATTPAETEVPAETAERTESVETEKPGPSEAPKQPAKETRKPNISKDAPKPEAASGGISAKPVRTAAPGDLKASGIDIPALYID